MKAMMPGVPNVLSRNSWRTSSVEIVRWINSDGQLRTDEQIIEEMIPMLGFARRGVRIESAIRYAIRHYRLWKK
jgi:hypothetical protein